MKEKKIMGSLLFIVCVFLLCSFVYVERYLAADIHTNAMEFFYATGSVDDKHIDIVDGTIYFGTRAKLAHTYVAGHKYYNTLGYDVTLSGGGRSLTFSVKRGGALSEVPNSSRTDNFGYGYLLYRIPTQTIIDLAQRIDPESAAVVLEASDIKVQLDAIVTVHQDGKQGNIVEDGNGGIIEYEENGAIYHLKNKSELEKMRSIFYGHKFFSYIEIVGYLKNYQLISYYNVGPASIGNSSYHKGVHDGKSNMLFLNGSIYNKQNYKLLQEFKLLDPGHSGLDLIYTGYHLDEGEEWIKEDGVSMSIHKTYTPKDIEPAVGYGNKVMVLYANWKPNTYIIQYHPNGGSGSMNMTYATYDTDVVLSKNTFTRQGYTFKGWSISENGGVAYTDEKIVKNLTTEKNGFVTLYAVWEKNIYTITLDNQQPTTEGTNVYYQKYDKGNYADKNCLSEINSIIKPSKTGYHFEGFYTGKDGVGTQHIDATGKILAKNNTFITDLTLYAKWTANTYTIQYHANGGVGEMEDTKAVYDTKISLQNCRFTRKGYRFVGWAKSSNGEVSYSDMLTVCNLTMLDNEVYHLYAKWEPIVVNITLDSQKGSGSTPNIYQQYETGFYIDPNLSQYTKKVMIPNWIGYRFAGFFTGNEGDGVFIDELGNILVPNTTFLQNTTLFAKYYPEKYEIFFHKQGGIMGTSSLTATYGKALEVIEVPVKGEFTFMGYWTEINGMGTQYYDEFGNSLIPAYALATDISLYAQWEDKSSPKLSLVVDKSSWTKDQVTLSAIAEDYGVGLSSVELYRIEPDGRLTFVKEESGLDGVNAKTITFVNEIEGIIRYKAVAKDCDGNIAESYNTVYYDTTKPYGEVEFELNGTTISIELDVTDINTGD